MMCIYYTLTGFHLERGGGGQGKVPPLNEKEKESEKRGERERERATEKELLYY